MKTAPDAPSEHESQRPLTDRIVNYYDETWLDYRVLWLNQENLAIHCGYTDATTRGHADALENMNRVLAERVKIRPGERVLDAGCGVGGSSLWLAAKREAEVVGITLSAKQVAKAREYATQRGLSDRVDFEEADFTATPFPDASFDVVWALESSCHAANKADFYREAFRLLRPGGRLVVADAARKSRPLEQGAERLLRECTEGWAVPDLDTASEHLEHLAAAGFVDADLEDATAPTRPSLRKLHRVAFWTYPFAVLGRLLGIRSSVQHGNTRTAILQYRGVQRGWWSYIILSATKPATVDA